MSAVGFNDYAAYYDIYACLLNSYSSYYDIDCMINFSSSNDGDLTVQFLPTGIIEDYSKYFSFSSGSTIRMFKNNSSFACDIYFKITNKSTGQIVHIKKCVLSGSGTNFNINDVINYDSQDDLDNNNGKSDFTGVTSGNSNLNNNFDSSYYENLVSTDNFIWEFFNKILFGLPSWFTTPIYLLLTGVVIITLYRMFRGA